MEPQKKLLMIVNPRAGRSKPRGPLYDAAAALCDAGYLLRIRRTTAAGDAARIAAQEGGDYDTVVAVGGDGTLNEVISGIQTLKTPPAVGYLPQGSTNDFAASLEIPSDPVQAAEAIVRDQRRQLDIGRFGERIFVYVASFGAFTRTSYTASQDVKNALGHFGYLLESLRDLDTLRPYKVRITADGETLDGEYLFGAVANSTSIAGFLTMDPTRVIIDDGLFEITLIKMPTAPMDLSRILYSLLLVPHPQNASELQNLIWALLNQQYNSGGLIFRHVSALHVETDEDLPWSLDGEYEPSQPTVDITNCQRALTMLL